MQQFPQEEFIHYLDCYSFQQLSDRKNNIYTLEYSWSSKQKLYWTMLNRHGKLIQDYCNRRGRPGCSLQSTLLKQEGGQFLRDGYGTFQAICVC